ncbi:P-loop NTPase [Modestobacter sp. VKM Ac-2985]|uniref:P-loop NTPase n=1 Tax=Modestobacter sp. VKM Ac-2985 TaxID=3004139 RepID=UPI0022AB9AB9|nr:SIR2 family protein [Modestobacter sp. VKM Ac-2985]MCZ2838485.1 SIR2 family protein [Modestobacter sp. VKM Ac-2985]
MCDLGLSAGDLTALRRAAANSSYHLLLGAGASLDSQSADGRLLPGAKRLAEELSTQFDVPVEDGDLLWRIYSRAVDKQGGAAVYAWLRRRFAMVDPPAWMDQYARFPWEFVWTLNLDDSFERSYSRVANDESRALRTVSWDDEFRLSRELAVVHLHGHVLDSAPRSLVFSLSEYADAAVARSAWPLAFRDTYGVSPMVIIGARLRDEPDIEAIVGRRLPEHDAPSFYVSPDISPAVEADLRAWRLVPVRMTAEEFADVWGELAGVDLNVAPTRLEELAFRVGRQFRELTTNKTVKIPRNHDLLGGDEPIWDDVRSSIHAELDWIRSGAALVRRFGQSIPASSALIYTGKRLSGRSTGLYAIALAFRRQSWRVLLYTKDERPDVDAIVQYAADGRALLLIFDGIADIAEDVATLLRRARNAGLQISVLAVDQFERSAGIIGRIPPNLLVDGKTRSINSRLTSTDAGRLVDRLQAAGRLGRLEAVRTDRERIAHFRRHELFAAMAELADAPGFGRRVGVEVGAVESEEDLVLLLFASVAARVDRRLPVIDAAQMMQMPSEQIVRMIRGEQLSSVLSTDGRLVGTRQRWLALQPVIDRLGEQSALSLLSAAIGRLSSRLSRSSQRERNATSLLVGSLMAYRNVAAIFPHGNHEAWYESLFNSFGSWSGRYWEQRAIMSRHLGETSDDALARAESYAQRAISLREDAYSYTTLGTVLAARGAKADRTQLGDYYDRTYDAFEKASDLDPENLVTWLAFLSHTLRLLERLAIDGEVDELWGRLTEDWLRIHDNVSSVFAATEDTRLELARLLSRYQTIISA